ncbi:MAG: AmmeMemoRadiSam system protein A, partial [Acidobacteriia bacterium]|nr:AmmeMemoRadiSam system protein A [Terriglobia bacterium]
MNPDRGDVLLAIARAEISRVLAHRYHVDTDSPWLAEQGACFVTLTRHGELRGCIGTLEAHRPLLHDVKANAVAAAFRDPRFPPLTSDELPHIAVEVSLLTPPEPMEFRDEQHALAHL